MKKIALLIFLFACSIILTGSYFPSNTMFTYRSAGGYLALDVDAYFILAWNSPITTEQDLTNPTNHNHDATYQGTMTTSDQIPIGLVWALDMDGNDDHLTISDNFELTFNDAGGPAGFTINAWVQMIAHTDSQMILAKWGSQHEEWALLIDEDEYLSMILLDDSVPEYESMQSDVALTTDTWYMVTAVYDGAGGAAASAGITLYVDGAPVAGTATDSGGGYVGMENLGSVVYVGANADANAAVINHWQGDLGMITLSPTELTADQVWELYIRTRGYYNQ